MLNAESRRPYTHTDTLGEQGVERCSRKSARDAKCLALPLTDLRLWFQCVKELSSLLLDQGLLLPSLKLLLGSQNEPLRAVALEQIASITKVSPGASPPFYVS